MQGKGSNIWGCSFRLLSLFCWVFLMRCAHTLTCMKSRRSGREESNGRIQQVSRVTQMYKRAHKPHCIRCIWLLSHHCPCSDSSHSSHDSLLSFYCPCVALMLQPVFPLLPVYPLKYGISCHCHVSTEKCWPSLIFSVLRALLRGFIKKNLSSCWASELK